MSKTQLPVLDHSEIVVHDFPAREYFQEEVVKTQICIHHTVSSKSIEGDINWWIKDPKRIATFCLIAYDGVMHKVFSSKYWAYHLGVKGLSKLEKTSIGIELDAYGGLVKKNGVWCSVYGNVIDPSEVVLYPKGYRGYYAFHKYSNEQIEKLRQLLVYLCKTYNIPADYNPTMWGISTDALNGKKGVWSHVSYRKDKSDCHPQEELVTMLKNLKDGI